jgi:hypothetical protein
MLTVVKLLLPRVKACYFTRWPNKWITEARCVMACEAKCMSCTIRIVFMVF